MRLRAMLPPFITALALATGVLVGAPAVQAANPPIVVWVDAAMRPAVRAALPKTFKKSKVIVRKADMANIGALLDQTPVAQAPDLILIPNELVGPLADVYAIEPIAMPTNVASSFNRAALAGFRHGTGYYGIPMMRQNMALVSNVNLVPTAPTTFARLAKRALAVTAAGKATVPLAVAQGPDGNAETTYPLFSGLGGYVFGANRDGSLNPQDTGLSNPAFRKNDALINQWNTTGLLRSSLTTEEARAAFLGGQSPFWITGPDDIQRLRSGTFRYRITAVPQIVSGIVPASMVKSWGFAMTSFAGQHKVSKSVQQFLTLVLATPDVQVALTSQSPITALPASTPALAKVTDPVLLAFGAAATSSAIPTPNVSQWAAAKSLLAGAWRDSTAGAEAIKARRAFNLAEEQLRAVTRPAATE
jgi:arabinogalactan oligomer / maltooligosaccharide transport system substrate-binding protein